MATDYISLLHHLQERSFPSMGGIEPTILKVKDLYLGKPAIKHPNNEKPLPAMSSPEASSAPGNDPAPGSKSDPATADFRGNVGVTDELPSKDIIEKAADIPVVDVDGKEVPFKSLYLPSNDGDKEERRTLIIFIRHFFCGVSCGRHLRYLLIPFHSEIFPMGPLFFPVL
jgi:hypothetical protein